MSCAREQERHLCVVRRTLNNATDVCRSCSIDVIDVVADVNYEDYGDKLIEALRNEIGGLTYLYTQIPQAERRVGLLRRLHQQQRSRTPP